MWLISQDNFWNKRRRAERKTDTWANRVNYNPLTNSWHTDAIISFDTRDNNCRPESQSFIFKWQQIPPLHLSPPHSSRFNVGSISLAAEDITATNIDLGGPGEHLTVDSRKCANIFFADCRFDSWVGLGEFSSPSIFLLQSVSIKTMTFLR